ncbi:MAG: hypothetical protein C5B58_02460 [Acidobacteria bacterium]|nr:MAG: hypothetical protein C5B58_02460 [Acidobacteriota bacterium]
MQHKSFKKPQLVWTPSQGDALPELAELSVDGPRQRNSFWPESSLVAALGCEGTLFDAETAVTKIWVRLPQQPVVRK